MFKLVRVDTAPTIHWYVTHEYVQQLGYVLYIVQMYIIN